MPPVSIWAMHAGGADTKCRTRRLPYAAQVYKGGGNPTDGSIFLSLCLLAPILLVLSASFLPPLAAMASNLPCSRFHTPGDLVVLRQVLGWQASGYEDWWCSGVAPPSNLQLREFIFFACYAAAGLVLPVPSFLLTMLEFY
jgi:hypothetical protein